MAIADKISVEMNDGRIVAFGQKQMMDKSYGLTPAGDIFVQIDFSHGETVRVEIDAGSKIALAAAGHGLSQKLGDAASGADTVQDAFEAVLEVASRVSAGDWNKIRASGEGSAKGAGELVTALCEVLNQPRDVVRDMLAKIPQAQKLALRKTPAVAEVIKKLREARAPSKKELEQADIGASLLEQLKSS